MKKSHEKKPVKIGVKTLAKDVYMLNISAWYIITGK